MYDLPMKLQNLSQNVCSCNKLNDKHYGLPVYSTNVYLRKPNIPDHL
jgi:hypothetical protein